MEEKEKINTKLKLAACLRKIMHANKNINTTDGSEMPLLVDGIRQLEASSRLSYTIVQGVSVGQRDPQFTTLITIIEEGLEMSLTEFSKIYDSITDDDLKATKKEIAEAKKISTKIKANSIKKSKSKSKTKNN